MPLQFDHQLFQASEGTRLGWHCLNGHERILPAATGPRRPERDCQSCGAWFPAPDNFRKKPRLCPVCRTVPNCGECKGRRLHRDWCSRAPLA